MNPSAASEAVCHPNSYSSPKEKRIDIEHDWHGSGDHDRDDDIRSLTGEKDLEQQQQSTLAHVPEAGDNVNGDDHSPSSAVDGETDYPVTYSPWRRLIRNFTPSWFSVTMGTGIVSILLYNLPYQFRGLNYIAIVIFALNIVLFSLALFASILRYTLYPEIWKVMIRHPVQSLFLGTLPMGFATLINMTVFACVPAWGHWILWVAWICWWIDATISAAICMYLPFLIMHRHHAKLDTMTAAWLLPIVSTIVAAASGGIVAEALPALDPQYALWTMVTSYLLWGTGIPLAMVVLTIYFHRLAVHNLPPREVIVSVFLPLGPLGQGGFAIMQLGRVAKTVLPETRKLTPDAGDILYTVGWGVATVMWGYGLVWLFFALASISATPKFPFNMGWWGFVFPLGVFTVACTTFGKELNSTFFKVLGTVLSVAVVLLWIVVSLGTLAKSWSGDLLYAPCLADLKQQRASSAEQERPRSWLKRMLQVGKID